MDTRPEHAQVAKPQSLCDKSGVVERNKRCPRQRFFVEARKRDDGEVLPIPRLRFGTSASWLSFLTLSAAVRETNARGRKPPESFVNNAG